jgi:methionyl-tRNA formyltransferase
LLPFFHFYRITSTMKIGIVTNNEICIPTIYFCGQQRLTASLFLQASPANHEEAIRQQCQHANIPVTTAPGGEPLYEWAAAEKPDIIFVAGYNQKIDLKRMPVVKHGIFNVHFGSLPEFRGPNPVFWQLRNGAKNIGMVIHRLTERFDSGPVVWEKNFKNEHYFNFAYINQVLANTTVEGVYTILSQILSGKALAERAQDQSKAAYFYRPVLKDVVIDWEQMDAAEICDIIKACNNWNVGGITVYNGAEVKIVDAHYYSAGQPGNAAPGTIINVNDTLEVACRNNEILRIHIFSMNGITLAARLAAFYGFTKDTVFTSSLLPA